MKRFALGIAAAVLMLASYLWGRIDGSRAVLRPQPSVSEPAVEPTRSAPAKSILAASTRPPTASGASIASALTTVERGYAAAQANLESALAQLSALPASERVGFIAGIFSFAAKTLPPAESLKISDKVPPELRPAALRALVGEWIYARGSLAEDKRSQMRDQAFASTGSRQSLEVELTARNSLAV